MIRLRGRKTRPWGLVGLAIIVLLVMIGTVGVVGVLENEQVKDAAERGIRFDVAIEDAGDDLRVAVLDLRHYHRNIVFRGPTTTAITQFDAAYAALLQQIDRLAELGVENLDVPQPDEIRAMAQQYHDDFRPRIVLFTSDPIAFNAASDAGLLRIAELELAAQEIDQVGERLTGRSLRRVEDAAQRERILLISLLAAAAVVGVAVVVAAGRVLDRLREANAQQHEATRRLAAALQTQSDFIADASHELRTPLTLIRGNAEIELATADGPDHQQALGEILTEATRMSRLVDDLLFLARSDAGVPPIEREYVPVGWLLERIGPSADVMTRHYGRCLTLELDGDGYLEIDPRRIEQVVSIAVDNASKFAPADTCVRIKSVTRDGYLTIDVIDNGPGIPAKDLPLIFERFYQAGRGRTRKRGGSGLGLAIAKSIVGAHGGAIAIDSAPGRGTRLTIRLPLSRQQ